MSWRKSKQNIFQKSEFCEGKKKATVRCNTYNLASRRAIARRQSMPTAIGNKMKINACLLLLFDQTQVLLASSSSSHFSLLAFTQQRTSLPVLHNYSFRKSAPHFLRCKSASFAKCYFACCQGTLFSRRLTSCMINHAGLCYNNYSLCDLWRALSHSVQGQPLVMYLQHKPLLRFFPNRSLTERETVPPCV